MIVTQPRRDIILINDSSYQTFGIVRQTFGIQNTTDVGFHGYLIVRNFATDLND